MLPLHSIKVIDFPNVVTHKIDFSTKESVERDLSDRPAFRVEGAFALSFLTSSPRVMNCGSNNIKSGYRRGKKWVLW